MDNKKIVEERKQYDKTHKVTEIDNVTLHAGVYRAYPDGKNTTDNGFNSSRQPYTIKYSLGFDTQGKAAAHYILEKIPFGLTDNERKYLLEHLQEEEDYVLMSYIRHGGKAYIFDDYLEPVTKVIGYTLKPTPVINEFTQLIHKTLDEAYESHLISYFREHYFGKTSDEIVEHMLTHDEVNEIDEVEKAYGEKLTSVQIDEVTNYFNWSVLQRIQFSEKGKKIALGFFNTLDEIELNYN